MWRLCWLERETSPLGSHIWTLGPLVIWGGDMASLKDVCHRGVRLWGSFFSPTSCVLSLLPVCVSRGSFRFLLWPQTAFPSLPLWTLSLSGTLAKTNSSPSHFGHGLLSPATEKYLIQCSWEEWFPQQPQEHSPGGVWKSQCPTLSHNSSV